MKAGSSQEWKGKYLFFRTGGKKPKHFICGRVCHRLFPVQIRVRGSLEKTSEISRDVVRRELETVYRDETHHLIPTMKQTYDGLNIRIPSPDTGLFYDQWGERNSKKRRKDKFVVCFRRPDRYYWREAEYNQNEKVFMFLHRKSWAKQRSCER